MTYREEFELALACETPDEADDFVRRNVHMRVTRFHQSPEEAEKILRINLGYMAGYYDTATSDKIARLFGAPHPGYASVR